MVGVLASCRTPELMPRAAELLARFDLEDAADRPLRTYSGGMRRRLDIAASLVTKPPVLFLDEPTTGLDLTSRNELWETISSSSPTAPRSCSPRSTSRRPIGSRERVAVVDGGKVIANDTPANLKAQLGSTVVEMGFEADGRPRRPRRVLAAAT